MTLSEVQQHKFFYVTRMSLVCALLALSLPAQAADTKDKLHHVEETLSQRKAEADALAARAAAQNAEVGDLRQKLIDASSAFSQKQEEQKTLQDKQDDLADDIAEKSKAFAAEKHKLSTLVIALIELGRQPPETLLWQSGLTKDYIHRTIYLRALLPRVRDEAEALGGDLVTLGELKSQMTEQERLTTAATENLNEQRQHLDQLVKTRQGLLQKTEAQKAELQAQLVALTNQAQDLRQLLEKVAPKKSGKSLPQSGPAPSLKWPVAGQQMRHFGDRDADGVRSEGVTFAALSGAPVVAPAPGHVVFAGPFKGYGPIVILQHAGGYYSFLSGFGRIDAEMGEDVAAGEPLGVMPVKSGAKPELYFEWRRNSEPVDPARNP
jgi:septal ring factor EnvC (AmiA/AmiB activator)